LTGPPGAVESVNAGVGITVTPNTTGNVIVSAPDAVLNNQDTFTTPKVKYIVSLTQAEYDGLVSGGTINANTLYIIL
jgi:hypothetical protein